jgi:hypothetical protein
MDLRTDETRVATPGGAPPRGYGRAGADSLVYPRLCAAGMRLNRALTGTIPREAMDAIGAALGLVREGTFVFENENVMAAMMDCCLYDWAPGGRNLVRTYAEEHPAREDPDEREVLEAALNARYTLLRPTRRVPGAGIFAHDATSGEELFLMDIGLSTSPLLEGIALATRIMPHDGYWTTTGAGLPVDGRTADRITAVLGIRSEMPAADLREALREPRNILRVVRTCLDAGMAEHTMTVEPGELPAAAAARAPREGRNAPCPCGSGRQYGKCCARGSAVA